jgi:hypothetical protein
MAMAKSTAAKVVDKDVTGIVVNAVAKDTIRVADMGCLEALQDQYTRNKRGKDGVYGGA